MNCKICDESNVGPEHEITEKHIKNQVLFEYARKGKQFAGNRKGAVVSCNVKSSFSSIVDHVDAKCKISVKPNEEIQFIFTVQNESKKEDLVVIFIQMAHNQLNFVMNNHNLSFGCTPVTIKPKKTLQKEISVTFKCGDIGQYEMPIIFSFRKPATNEGILIMRNMVVFVEEQQRVHEKIISPYVQKEVKAKNLFKTTMTDQGDNMFRIPKNYKSIYASGLKVKNASKEDEQLCQDIREIFKTGTTKENYVRYFHNLLWYEETIIRINLKKYNMSNVPLLPQGDAYGLVVPGLAEKRPSLMLGDLLFVKPHNNEDVMFEAVIAEMSADNVISIKGLHTEFKKYFSYSATFDIRFFMSRLPLERMHRAVQGAVKGHPDQKRVFPEWNQQKVNVKPIENYYNPLVESNPEQRRAVEHIVAGSMGAAPYLLHGPPGTGKTVTIVEAALQLVTLDPTTRILICTDSNMAADHVATQIIKYAHMFGEKLLLRASSQFRVWETLPQCLRKYSNGWNKDNFEPVSIEKFIEYNIVITTLSHAAKFATEVRRKKLERPMKHLFIDEAAQASEPACLIPVTGLLCARGGRLTLAGDPHQLGPVVISHNARKLGLGLSLMERLKNTSPLYNEESAEAAYTLMLRNNFRSDPALLLIPNQLFYKQQLQALAAADPLSSTDIMCERAHSRAIVFHAVLSKEQRMGKSPSYYNNMELEVVQSYIKKLITRHRVQPEDIGVVTPYIRQVYKIKTWLGTTKWGGIIEVGTVEAFQGKEKRVIIISTVRANCSLLDHDAKFQLGFLVDDKRFNVALTRAKAKAIIIGNPLCLEKDEKWRKYIQMCREFGTYFGFDTQQLINEGVKKDIVNRIAPMLKDMKVNKA